MRIDTSTSFAYFVYPFLFDAETFTERVAAVEWAQWQRGQQSQAVWQTSRFPEDELLAHVARYLNPPEDTLATARLWKLNDALRDVYGLAERADWQLMLQKGTLPFRFGAVGTGVFAVQLALFRIGVGFLTVHAQPLSEHVDDWQDFVHYFRFLRGQRGTGVRASRRVGRDQVSPFFPEPAGGVAPASGDKRLFGEVLEALLCTGIRATESPAKPWWREVFIPKQVLPFAVFYVDDMPVDEIPCLLYKVRNVFHAAQGESPAPADLHLDHPTLLPYAEQQWFVFSLDGGAFVACDAPAMPFWRQTLPQHLRDQYFLLLLLVLHQRFALMGLSEQVAQHWLVNGDVYSEEEREAAFTRIRDGLLSFTARGYFTQVMQREHHHRCYCHWQETFQVERLYQEVSHEVWEMSDYLLLRRTERIEQLQKGQRQQQEAEARAEAARDRAAQEQTRRLEERISLFGVWIGLGIGVPALVLSFLSINLHGLTAKDEGLLPLVAALISLAALGVGALLAWFVRWRLRRKAQHNDRDRGGA